ncbi:sulfotransferase [uncultured Roseibium sp.]|uniref:sulfotransferase family protein n=1 Tax=uncultured Roseibium sp. TaxID=1936171 RepID=UPI00321744AA
MNPEKFVLVTGCPRSGTTVVGELLSLALNSYYLYEPMNALSGDTIFKNYFAIPGDETFPEPVARDFLNRMQKLNLRLQSGLWPHEKGWIRFRKQLIGGRSRVSLRLCKLHPFLKTVIWKDPFAFFAIPFILEHTDFPVVITHRPIEGIAASFKRFGWGFDLRDLVKRMNDPSLPKIPADLDLSNSVVNAAVLWCIMDAKAQEYQKSGRVKIIEIDDLIADPLASTEGLYQHCGLPLTDKLHRKVEARYSKDTDDKVPTHNTAHVRKRNIKAVNSYWKKVLDDDELAAIERVKGMFQEI